MHGRLVLVLLLVFTVFSAFANAEENDELTPKETAALQPILTGVARATSVTLYEGLPHHRWQADVLARELKTKRTLKIDGFPFYQKPLKISGRDVEHLRKLCTSLDSYYTYGRDANGEVERKACGGYHPDYCLAWKDGKDVHFLSICHGCGEMRARSAKGSISVNLRNNRQLGTILQKYRQQRPKTQFEQ